MTANEMFNRFTLMIDASRKFNRTFNEREVSDFLNLAQLQLIQSIFTAFKNSKGIGYDGKNIQGVQIPTGRIVKSAEISGLISGTAEILQTQMIQGNDTNGALPKAEPDTQNIDSAMYGVFVPLPDEAMYILNERVYTQKDLGGGTYQTKPNVPTREVSFEEYNRGIYDYYARPYDSLVWSMDWGSYTTAILSGGSYTQSTKNMTGLSPDGVTTATIDTRRSRYLLTGKDWKVFKYWCSYLKQPADIVIDLVPNGNPVDCQLADFLHKDVIDLAVYLATTSLITGGNKLQRAGTQVKQNE